nr:D599 [uncultured bacterium]
MVDTMMVKILWSAVVASTVTLGIIGVAQSPSTRETAEVVVSRDGRALEIQRASDRAPVRVSVLDRCGDPKVGEARIRSTQLTDESVSVTYGKHCETKVDLKTLAVECTGCD